MRIDTKAFRNDRERLLKNLKKIQKHFSVDALTKLLGISPATWYNRLKSPENITYRELRAISRYTGISFETITAGVVSLK